MDCLTAAETLSAAHDGVPVEPGQLDRAHAHCAACPECAAFAETLARVAHVAPPRAPATLVEGIIEATRVEADALKAAPAPQTAVFGTAEAAQRSRRGFLPPWWQPRMTAFVSAAAVLLVGVVASLALIGQSGLTGSDTDLSQSLDSYTIDATVADDAGGRGAEESAEAVGEAPAEDAPSTTMPAPPYVMWNETVYVHTGELLEIPSEATTQGVTVSDLDDPEGPRERAVIVDPDDPATIFVRTSDGGVMGFERVVRTLGLREYALVTDQAIPTFGTWPRLPSRFETPEADGSPAFTLIGFDDLNVDVYVPPAGDMADGFAVAPGTSPDDPAAGNPYWTWWEPVP